MKLAPPMKNISMYHRTFSGKPSVQVASEFLSLLELCRVEGVTSYLEIGCARGDTFHEVVSGLPVGSLAVAVDFPEQKWSLSDSEKDLRAAVRDLRERGYDAHCIIGNSRDKDVISEVTRFAPFDLVFIDGDHSYEGVKADYENYGLLGRIAAFHDIVDSQLPNLLGEVVEVPRFWSELKRGSKAVEFAQAGSTMGIGVIWG